jgi:hypothetical protein
MSESALGVYLYCIAPPSFQPELDGLVGVDGRASVEKVSTDWLTAIVSRVPLEEFGPEPLKHNLEDLNWLERAARAHDSVLAAMMSVEAVVPMRLLTIFTDESRLRDMLDRNRESLVQTLGRLRGHSEWSIKLLADRGKLERAALDQDLQPTSTGAGPDSPGRAFFARKQGERAIRQKARELAEAAARETYESLRRQVADSRLLPAQHPDLSGRSGDMILNAAYLVDRGQSEAFAATAGQLRDRYRSIGVTLEVSGPWAPYNFVDETEETASARDDT